MKHCLVMAIYMETEKKNLFLVKDMSFERDKNCFLSLLCQLTHRLSQYCHKNNVCLIVRRIQ
jgi:hypothetical protein